ncbi:hypothetical protein [Bacillus toyonensis]|uniref:hypothetical protein n=1 Tax=Bacillus toyonensis TaxID=155322 RepID=UPI000BFA646D|nr:hypothetical protein [Bacillus toyonensis]PGF05154.1 hypothetical protein COM61_01650 [Bacillus toyonensis]
MAKTLKQDAYSFLGSQLEEIGSELVVGYDKDYGVIGIAKNKAQLKQVLKTKGIAGVIIADRESCAVGYDFIKGEQYLGMSERHGHISDYLDKEKVAIYGNGDTDKLVIENNDFILKLMEFLDKNNISYNDSTYAPIRGHKYMYEITVYNGRCSTTISKNQTYMKTSTDILVVHDSTRDVEFEFYAEFLCKVLNIDFNVAKQLIVNCYNAKGLYK